MMILISKHIKDFIGRFSKEDLASLGGLRHFAMSTLGVGGMGATLAILDDRFKEAGRTLHLDDAVSEIIGSSFEFNLFGCVGLFFYGLSLTLAKLYNTQRRLARISNYLLQGAFSTGALSFGALLNTCRQSESPLPHRSYPYKD